MAKPRVFVSSTYFDLRSIRDDLDRFIRELGYEPVRHERGQIPYGAEGRPEEYAYREIDFCEILVCVVGGRYGTTAHDASSSITQKELRLAHQRGKQVYIFVDENVLHEHRLYLANKGVAGVKYTAVDNIKIHEFLEEIHGLPRGNPIFPFAVSSQIAEMLSEQWAGLFQRLLTEHAGKSQAALIDELQRSLQTAGQLVQFLVDQKGKGDHAVQEILFANHPLFEHLRQTLNNKYRLYFTSLTELQDWLGAARNYLRVQDLDEDYDDYYEWRRTFQLRDKLETRALYIKKSLFTPTGELRPMAPAGWEDDFLKTARSSANRPQVNDALDDDIPF
jgi:hypothetical protein